MDLEVAWIGLEERHEDGTFVRLIAYSIDHQGETRMREGMIPF